MRLPFRRLDIPDDVEAAIQPRLYLILILGVLALAYVIAFGIENNKQRAVHFVFATASVSQAWLILISLAVGVILGVALSQLHRHRQRRRQTQQTA